MKRLFAFTLSALMILAMVVSCNKNDTTSEETTQPIVDTSSDVPSYLQNLDFEGSNVTIHIRGDEEAVKEIGLEDFGDVLSSALYKRTSATSARLNVELGIAQKDGWATYNNTIAELRNSINSGFGDYDLVAGWSPRIVPLVFEGLFLDLNEYETYDGNAEWWSESVTSALTICGSTYLTTGDIATTYMDSCLAVMVNEAVSSAFQYSYDSFYDIVYSGEWTMDYFYQLVKDAYIDDGDKVRDTGDTFGLVTYPTFCDGFWSSCEISVIKNNGVDAPTLEFGIEHIQSVSEKVYKLLYDNVGTEVAGNLFSDPDAQFTNDRAMFIISALGLLEKYSSDMETVYGVLPFPKFDTNQKDYHTYVQQSMSLWGIPKDAVNSEMSCAVLSSFAYDSNRLVIEPHYERLLKTRYVKDSTSGYMIDLIYNNIWMNFDTLYNEALGTSVSASSRNSMPVYIFRLMENGSEPNIPRWWEEQGEGLTRRLGTMLASVQ